MLYYSSYTMQLVTQQLVKYGKKTSSFGDIAIIFGI